MTEEREEMTPRLAGLLQLMQPPGNASTSNANFQINAGGVGVWLATTACLVMLAMNIILGLVVLDHSRKIDELNTYLTAVYMMAPQLKPPEK